MVSISNTSVMCFKALGCENRFPFFFVKTSTTSSSQVLITVFAFHECNSVSSKQSTATSAYVSVTNHCNLFRNPKIKYAIVDDAPPRRPPTS